MIGHLITAVSEGAAKADPVTGKYWSGTDGWSGDLCIPNVQVTVTRTGLPYDNNWRMLIMRNARDPDLSALTSCQLVYDCDSGALLYSVLTTVQLSHLTLQPIPAGSSSPFGNPQ